MSGDDLEEFAKRQKHRLRRGCETASEWLVLSEKF